MQPRCSKWLKVDQTAERSLSQSKFCCFAQISQRVFFLLFFLWFSLSAPSPVSADGARSEPAGAAISVVSQSSARGEPVAPSNICGGGGAVFFYVFDSVELFDHSLGGKSEILHKKWAVEGGATTPYGFSSCGQAENRGLFLFRLLWFFVLFRDSFQSDVEPLQNVYTAEGVCTW